MDFPSCSQSKPQELWNGQEDHKQVQDDVHNSMSPRKGVEVDATTLCLAGPAGPRVRYRQAVNCCNQDESDDVADADADGDIHGKSEQLRRKDPQVEYENGNLRESGCGHIEYLC